MKKTSIIIDVSEDEFEYFKAAVDSIRRFTEQGTYELVIVEHGASYSVREWLAEQTDLLTLFHDTLLSRGQAWNMGIKAASGEQVVLLHSDTLVTDHWLDYMIQSLYLKEDVAGIGPMSNDADDDQKVEVDYKTIEELLRYAQSHNSSFGQEEKLVISNFCMLFKKDILMEIGLLNEGLSTKELSVDCCLRVIQLGYKLMLCRQAFVHHYGEDDPEDCNPSERFKSKWGFDISLVQQQTDILNMLPSDSDKNIHILEIGSGCGATILKNRQKFPSARIVGVEPNVEAKLISQRFHELVIDRFEVETFKEEKFDYIIINSMVSLDSTLNLYNALLKPNGKLIANLPNMHNCSTVTKLTKGDGLYERDITSWSLESISKAFLEAGLDKLKVDFIKTDISKQNTDLMLRLKGFNKDSLPPYFDVDRFLISAEKGSSIAMLHKQFNMLLQNPDEDLIDSILKTSFTSILNAVETYSGSAVLLLNYLAISNFERNNIEHVFPLLMKAYEMDTRHPTTLMNLSTVYYGLGDDEQALNWLEKMESKSEQIEIWILSLKKTINVENERRKRLKLLLLRIEYNVQRQQALIDLDSLLKNDGKKLIDMQTIIEQDILNKESTLYLISNYFYENEEFDRVLLICELVLRHSVNDQNLLYIGYVLIKLGRYNDAILYLKQIQYPDTRTLGLINQIENNRWGLTL
ncbi:GT2 family glycosyltransferase/precorrin-6B methylase 2 [Paenibacillus sp. 1182]|uniref:glycosyltransferase n=1 Tax=Paenibacillus sp. 1182 TaxID=2806565 RepID=UPI000FA08030|nr:glycosyltransferase [Paenibacillus sp. 1182]MBP1308054.1 GT2 family glycosyltransferase/precorrin-6B methylase 2 [Paenibacillus sp. 1182]